jgi:vancomycin resistance protein YoaR
MAPAPIEVRCEGPSGVRSWMKVRRNRARLLIVMALGAVVGAVAVVAAWLIDSRAHKDAVLPNVVLGDKRVRGMSADKLATWVESSAGQFAGATIIVRTTAGGDAFQATVPELGVTVNQERSVQDALSVGRRGSFARRFYEWAWSFVRPVKLPISVTVDERKLDQIVAERDKGRIAPVEPSLAVADGRLTGVAGKNGRGVDPAQLAKTLGHAKPSAGTLEVTMDITSVPPRFSKDDADRVAAEGEKVAAAGLTVASGDQKAAIPPESLRSWLRAVPGDHGLQLALKSDDAVLGELATLLPDAGVRPVDAGFTVSGGKVSITAGKTGTACCTPGALEALNAALVDPAKQTAPIEVPLKTVNPSRDEEAARKLGIVEQVATFTTPHNAGEPRVTNIHLMADTIRGTVIPPGGTFSINGIVGQRTKAKGYVEAPIIGGDYKFDTDVGGGVSQFATTMFNAAFFAGLEIPEYAMHGLYISRYPYGREATLSFPGPDLKVRNPTPYGILVWPTYTNSSITVTLYSTKYFADVSQSGQTTVERPATPPPSDSGAPTTTLPDTPPPPSPGPCVTVTTERTRAYLDGRTSTDRFSGLYAPAEGWSCQSRG